MQIVQCTILKVYQFLSYIYLTFWWGSSQWTHCFRQWPCVGGSAGISLGPQTKDLHHIHASPTKVIGRCTCICFTTLHLLSVSLPVLCLNTQVAEMHKKDEYHIEKNGFFLKHYKGILFPHMPYNTWNIQINNHLLVNLLCRYILPGLVLHPPGQNLMPATTDSLHLYF